MKKNACIILAAGSSSRLGHPKQLLPHNGASLIIHTAAVALKTTDNVTVVLGANADVIKKELSSLPVNFAYNGHWEDGMSSSISCGLTAMLEKEPGTETATLLVCDQPYLSEAILNGLMTTYEETKKPIVASTYKETVGIPVLFAKAFFETLLTSSGASGAKKIILQNMDSAATVPFPLGYVDIDSQADYEALQKQDF